MSRKPSSDSDGHTFYFLQNQRLQRIFACVGSDNYRQTTPTDVLVLVALNYWQQPDDDATIHVAVATLERMTLLNRTTIMESLKRLEGCGLLLVVSRQPRRPTAYRLGPALFTPVTESLPTALREKWTTRPTRTPQSRRAASRNAQPATNDRSRNAHTASRNAHTRSRNAQLPLVGMPDTEKNIKDKEKNIQKYSNNSDDSNVPLVSGIPTSETEAPVEGVPHADCARLRSHKLAAAPLATQVDVDQHEDDGDVSFMTEAEERLADLQAQVADAKNNPTRYDPYPTEEEVREFFKNL